MQVAASGLRSSNRPFEAQGMPELHEATSRPWGADALGKRPRRGVEYYGAKVTTPRLKQAIQEY